MKKNHRIASIDIFRSLTMFLMIFVNDLWTLNNIPVWLLHTKAEADGMGLSDWVFPGFLFIVGLSIPFGISSRLKKGASTSDVLWHIVKRSFALIVMSLFMVNYENINNDLLPFSKYIWEILMALAIILIWNIYPNNKAFNKIPDWAMQFIGIAILVYLGIIYKSGTQDNPTGLQPYWWGILGIIGWTYLLCATVILFLGKKIIYAIFILMAFHMMNALDFMDIFNWKTNSFLMVDPSNHASVFSGIIASLLFLEFSQKRKKTKLFITLILIIAAVSIGYGLLTRTEWGISKIRSTPSWTTICAGISYLVFISLYLISDIYKQTKWAAFISAAGTSTLTCYLIPYLFYPTMMLIGLILPEALRTGFIGILKSLLFSYLIIAVTGLLGKIHVRLKV